MLLWRCFSFFFFLDEINIDISVNFEYGRLPFVMAAGLSQSIGGLHREKKKEFCSQIAFGLDLNLFPKPLACWPTLQMDSPSIGTHVMQFLRINLAR